MGKIQAFNPEKSSLIAEHQFIANDESLCDIWIDDGKLYISTGDENLSLSFDEVTQFTYLLHEIKHKFLITMESKLVPSASASKISYAKSKQSMNDVQRVIKGIRLNASHVKEGSLGISPKDALLLADAYDRAVTDRDDLLRWLKSLSTKADMDDIAAFGKGWTAGQIVRYIRAAIVDKWAKVETAE